MKIDKKIIEELVRYLKEFSLSEISISPFCIFFLCHIHIFIDPHPLKGPVIGDTL